MKKETLKWNAIRLYWKAKQILGIGVDRKITLESLIFHTAPDYEILIDDFDPEENCYCDVLPLFDSEINSSEEYEETMKKYGKYAVSCVASNELGKVTIYIEPTDKEIRQMKRKYRQSERNSKRRAKRFIKEWKK